MRQIIGVMLLTLFLAAIPSTIFATGAFVITSENEIITDCRATVIQNKRKSSTYCNNEGYVNFPTAPADNATVQFISSLEGLSSTSVSGFMFTSDTPHVVVIPYKDFQSTFLHKGLKRMPFSKMKELSRKHDKSLKNKRVKAKKIKEAKDKNKKY